MECKSKKVCSNGKREVLKECAEERGREREEEEERMMHDE